MSACRVSLSKMPSTHNAGTHQDDATLANETHRARNRLDDDDADDSPHGTGDLRCWCWCWALVDVLFARCGCVAFATANATAATVRGARFGRRCQGGRCGDRWWRLLRRRHILWRWHVHLLLRLLFRHEFHCVYLVCAYEMRRVSLRCGFCSFDRSLWLVSIGIRCYLHTHTQHNTFRANGVTQTTQIRSGWNVFGNEYINNLITHGYNFAEIMSTKSGW